MAKHAAATLILAAAVGLLLQGAKIINMDMWATIMRMRQQSQIHGQSPTLIAQYPLVLFS